MISYERTKIVALARINMVASERPKIVSSKRSKMVVCIPSSTIFESQNLLCPHG
jgi:hypothetical protein